MDNLKVTAKADPKRPYKMYAAMLSAFISSIIASGIEQSHILLAVEVAVVASLAVYIVGNPIKVTKTRALSSVRESESEDPSLF